MHLADYMAQKKLSDDDVAAKIGRSRVSVSRYRRGLVRPDWEAIERIETFTRKVVRPEDWKRLSDGRAGAA